MKFQIIFFGQDWRSEIVLKKLLKAKNFKVVAVVTLPDKPRGRKKEIISNPIRQLAQKHQIPVFDLATMKRFMVAKRDEFPEIGILASFGKKIPKKTINFLPKGILVVHPSLLPQYRGPKPVAWTILRGEKETGVTIFKMDEKWDRGPIAAQFKEAIKPDETTKALEKRLFEAAAEVLVTILPAYLQGKISPRPQDESQKSYAPKLTRSMAKIDWSQKSEQIDRLIRAMTPWPGAWTEVIIPDRQPKPIDDRQPKRLKILKAHLKNGKLVLDQVQLEGKKSVSWQQFCQGYPEAKIVKK